MQSVLSPVATGDFARSYPVELVGLRASHPTPCGSWLSSNLSAEAMSEQSAHIAALSRTGSREKGSRAFGCGLLPEKYRRPHLFRCFDRLGQSGEPSRFSSAVGAFCVGILMPT